MCVDVVVTGLRFALQAMIYSMFLRVMRWNHGYLSEMIWPQCNHCSLLGAAAILQGFSCITEDDMVLSVDGSQSLWLLNWSHSLSPISLFTIIRVCHGSYCVTSASVIRKCVNAMNYSSFFFYDKVLDCGLVITVVIFYSSVLQAFCLIYAYTPIISAQVSIDMNNTEMCSFWLILNIM